MVRSSRLRQLPLSAVFLLVAMLAALPLYSEEPVAPQVEAPAPLVPDHDTRPLPRSAAGEPDPLVPIPTLHDAEAARRANILKALDASASASAEFEATPLAEAIRLLAHQHGIPIVIDQRALDDCGLDVDIPITLSLNGVSLRSLLRRMLDQVELTYVIRDEVLSVTSGEMAERRMTTQLYPVPDLADEHPTSLIADGPASRLESLVGLIQSQVHPESWDCFGGPGSIAAFDSWNVLSITQTDYVHEQVEALLAAIRRVRDRDPSTDAGVVPEPLIHPRSRDAHMRIEAALETEVSLDFDATPLSEVVSVLATRHDISIVVDQRVLEDSAWSLDTPITFSVKDVSLRSALRLMLKAWHVGFFVRNESLIITDFSRLAHDPASVVYPVSDLVNAGTAGASAAWLPDPADQLVGLIVSTVAPDSWDDVGGIGSIEIAASWGLMVVSQTDEVQRQIAGLLAAARRARSTRAPDSPTRPAASPWPQSAPGRPGMTAPGLGAPAPTGPGMAPFGMINPFDMPGDPGPAMVLRVYWVDSEIPSEQLIQAIQGSIEPGNWAPAGIAVHGFPGGLTVNQGTVFPVGSRLLIRHRPQTHVLIEQLLNRLGAGGAGTKVPRP